jgi:hypothetical protein
MRGRAAGRWLGTAIAAVLLSATSTPAVVLRGSEATGEAGGAVDIAVILESRGEVVAGVQNDIEVRSPLFLADAESCIVNPAIGQQGFFNLLPCESGDSGCERLRGVILSLDAIRAIPDGAELYRCHLTIDHDAAAGAYRFPITNGGAATPAGDPLVTAGIGGRVRVGDAPTALLQVDGSDAVLGFFGLPVRLVEGAGAATVTVDLVLSDALDVTSGIANDPHCEAVLPGADAVFAFQPPGCAPDDHECTALRATISSAGPLPSGAVLFQCHVDPVPVIEHGDHVADCVGIAAAAADGTSIPAYCRPDVLHLVDPTREPTPVPPEGTPSAAPTRVHGSPTPTGRLVLRSPTPTAVAGLRGGDTDGCQITAEPRSGSLLVLFAPALLLARRGRRAYRGRRTTRRL